jgi:hypothetical protein
MISSLKRDKQRNKAKSCGSAKYSNQIQNRHLPVLLLALLLKQTGSSEALSMPFDLYGAILWILPRLIDSNKSFSMHSYLHSI